ncbi:conserved hypothetical protein, partial [Ricinus communis]
GRAALRLKPSSDLVIDASVTASNIKGGINDAYAGLAPYTTAAYNHAYATRTVVTGIAAQNIPEGSRVPYAPRIAATVNASYYVP